MMKLLKDSHWADIHALFATRDNLFAPFRHFVDAQGTMNEASVVPGSTALLPEPTIEDLIRARAGMRDGLDRLRDNLSQDLSERDVYYILFPIVAHLDEEVQTRYVDPIQLGPEAAASLAAFINEHADYADPIQLSGWPSFQRELFDTDAAGELFYTTIDDLLLKPQTLPLIFEVFYFCLNDGFRGRLVNNPAKRQEYMDRLKSRIPTTTLEIEPLTVSIESPRQPSLMEIIPPPWFYVGAVVGVAMLYFILKWLGSSWNPMMN